MRELKFYYDKNGTATDYSKEMSDLLRDPIMLDYVAADDALVIGLYKPFRQIYIEMQKLWDEAAQTLWITHGVQSYAYKPGIAPATSPHGTPHYEHFMPAK